MSVLFIVALIAYVIYAVATNPYREEHESGGLTWTAVVFQTPLFLLACYFGWKAGVFSRDLVHVGYVALGLLAGHCIFGVSLLVTHGQLQDAWVHFLDVRALWRFFIECPAMLTRFFTVSISEEMIYRVAAQGILLAWFGWDWLAIVLVAVLFSVVHWHFFRNAREQRIEFVCFALLLGGLYYWSGSFILVVVVHTMRNLEIVYLEYLVKLEELGDEAAALDALEAVYHRDEGEASESVENHTASSEAG